MRRKTVGRLAFLALAGFVLAGRGGAVAQSDRVKVSSWERDALRTLQQDKDARDRVKALRVLSRSSEGQLIPILAHYASYDTDPQVREAAARAVSQIRQANDRWAPPAFPRFNDRGLLADEHRGDRDRLDQAREAVEELRAGRRASRREDAARTLGRVGGPGAIPFLAHAAAYDADPTVRHTADRALERVRKREARWTAPPPPRFEWEEARDRPKPPVVDETTELITASYGHYLGRRVSPAEVRQWTEHLRRGGTYGDMLVTLLSSQEYADREAQGFGRAGQAGVARRTVRWYSDLLRRQPNEQEVRNWLDRWRIHGDPQKVAREFVDAALKEWKQNGFWY